MEHVVQPSDHTCAHACLAMTLGHRLEEVMAKMPDRPISEYEKLIYLRKTGATVRYFEREREEERGEVFLQHRLDSLKSYVDRGHPFIAVLPSYIYPKKYHSVVFHEDKVLDPVAGGKRYRKQQWNDVVAGILILKGFVEPKQ